MNSFWTYTYPIRSYYKTTLGTFYDNFLSKMGRGITSPFPAGHELYGKTTVNLIPTEKDDNIEYGNIDGRKR